MESLTVYLGKLRSLVEGALRTIERRQQEFPNKDQDKQRAFWQGYRQCLDDVEDFVTKNPITTREETVT